MDGDIPASTTLLKASYEKLGKNELQLQEEVNEETRDRKWSEGK